MANNAQIRIRRKIATVPVVAGGFAFVDLPRGYDYESLFLRINGGLQVTVAAASVRAEAPLQVLARIEVVADGKNTLVSIPGHMAALANVQRPIQQNGARVTTPPTGVGVATYQVEAGIAVDFANPNGIRPKDSNFRTSQLALFQLRMTFGAAADCFIGGTENFSAMNVDIFTSELIEFKGADGSVTMPIALRKVSYQEVNVPASNAAMELRLPAGNFIGGVIVRAEGSVAAGEPSAAMLNKLTARVNEDTRLNLGANDLRMQNNMDYGQLMAGYYIFNPMSLGWSPEALSLAWDATGQQEPKMVFDVIGGANNKLQVATVEYLMARA